MRAGATPFEARLPAWPDPLSLLRVNRFQKLTAAALPITPAVARGPVGFHQRQVRVGVNRFDVIDLERPRRQRGCRVVDNRALKIAASNTQVTHRIAAAASISKPPLQLPPLIRVAGVTGLRHCVRLDGAAEFFRGSGRGGNQVGAAHHEVRRFFDSTFER
jgi:hypothetical protein